MDSKIIILFAEYGFGPASKALLIAESLSSRYSVSIACQDRHIERILEWSADSVNVVSESSVFDPPYDGFSAFSCFICVMHRRAAEYLERLGFGEKTIFFDSLAGWREDHPCEAIHTGIVHRIAQYYPGKWPTNLEVENVVSPITWSKARDISPQFSESKVVMHFGGIISPHIYKRDAICLIQKFVGELAALWEPKFGELIIVGPDVPVDFNAGNAIKLICSSRTPMETANLFAQSKFVVSTPGLEAIFECLYLRKPVLVMPPMNSTQSHQYSRLIKLGLTPVIEEFPDEAFKVLGNAQLETARCFEFYENNHKSIAEQLVSVVSKIVELGVETALPESLQKLAIGREIIFDLPDGVVTLIRKVESIAELTSISSGHTKGARR